MKILLPLARPSQSRLTQIVVAGILTPRKMVEHCSPTSSAPPSHPFTMSDGSRTMALEKSSSFWLQRRGRPRVTLDSL